MPVVTADDPVFRGCECRTVAFRVVDVLQVL